MAAASAARSVSSVPEPQPTVFEAWSAVMEEVQAVRKSQRNTQQGYNFRGIDAVVNAVGPALRKHKVFVVPQALNRVGYRDVQTSTGKPSREVTVEVTYRVYGPTGDSFDFVAPGESMDFGDKGSPKAMSVAYRTALLQALCIPTDDPDPDAQSYERGGEQQRHEPSGRDWVSEACGIKDLGALLSLGRECNAFGEFTGPVKEALLARRAELEKAGAEPPPA